MALQLSHSVFFHVPGTGAEWVRSSLLRAGIAGEELPVRKATIDPQIAAPPDVKKGRKFRFCFVRHPVTYLQSYWAQKLSSGWLIHDRFDRFAAAETFLEFVERVVHEDPRWLDRLYGRYIGWDQPRVHFIGKYEHLADDLIHALHLGGEEFEEAAVRAVPVADATLEQRQAECAYPPGLEEKVRSTYGHILERFGYE